MYSIVLATAIVASATTPAHCWRSCHGGWSCHGCYGSHGCYSGYGAYSGYSGYSDYACHGCHGCWGGHHVPLYGCAGPMYGYHGGCYGAGYGPGYGPFVAGSPFGHYGCTGCYGCYGGYAGYGIPVPIDPRAGERLPDPFPPVNPEGKKDDKKREEIPAPKEPKKDDKKDGKNEEEQATLRIEIPQGGKLFVDGRAVNGRPGIQAFRTPALAAGQRYFYDIRIEVEINGRVQTEERRVIVERGQTTTVEFANLRERDAIAGQ